MWTNSHKEVLRLWRQMNLHFQLKQANILSHTDPLPSFISSLLLPLLRCPEVSTSHHSIYLYSLNTRITFTKIQVKIISYNSEATERRESKSSRALPQGSGRKGGLWPYWVLNFAHYHSIFDSPMIVEKTKIFYHTNNGFMQRFSVNMHL